MSARRISARLLNALIRDLNGLRVIVNDLTNEAACRYSEDSKSTLICSERAVLFESILANLRRVLNRTNGLVVGILARLIRV